MTEALHETVALAAPSRKGAMSVEQALAGRRSRRAYSGSPVTLAEIGQLLWAAQGITGPEGQRTAPSACALFPLQVYLSATRVDGLAPGIYKYNPDHHDLTLHVAGDKRSELTAAARDQDCMRFSACAILFAAVFEPTVTKCGERGVYYVYMEAAHASENVFLQATALDLGTCAIGSFEPAKIRCAAMLSKEEEPVYIMTIGRRS
jgi:SagB-type dehydrogenase family enzyme